MVRKICHRDQLFFMEGHIRFFEWGCDEGQTAGKLLADKAVSGDEGSNRTHGTSRQTSLSALNPNSSLSGWWLLPRSRAVEDETAGFYRWRSWADRRRIPPTVAACGD